MKLTIDTDTSTLIVLDGGTETQYPLYCREAFEAVSRQWVRIGWAAQYYFTFTWLGLPILQLPEDLVRLQEVIFTLKPDVIVETGIYEGGSLLFHATLCEALGRGRVIGVDKVIGPATRSAVEEHRLSGRIQMIEGDSAGPDTVSWVRSQVKPGESVLVILDSHHSKEHVARELQAYSELVTPGSCLVVTDGIMRDLADVPGGSAEWVDDNPASAALEFAALNPEFVLRQPSWLFHRGNLEQNITYWPDGWLWRTA